MVCLKLGHSFKRPPEKKFAWVQKILSTYAKIITLLFKKTSQVTDINHVPFFWSASKTYRRIHTFQREARCRSDSVHWKRFSWRDKTLFPLIFHLRLDEFSLFSKQTTWKTCNTCALEKGQNYPCNESDFVLMPFGIFPSRRSSLPCYCDSKKKKSLFHPLSVTPTYPRNPDLRISMMGKNGPLMDHHYFGMDDPKSLIKMFSVSLHL